MANRSYLYSLSNRPTSYRDRPETISGVSEWAYDVPFIFRLLMSGDPQVCASLISEGLDGEAEGPLVPIHAISALFDPGFARVQRFVAIVKSMIAMGLVTAPQRVPEPIAAPAPASLLGRIKRLFGSAPKASAPQPANDTVGTEHLSRWLDDTVGFLQAHRDDFLLLETVELDMMTEGEEEGLRECVEREIENCRQVGAALDALPADLHEAARLLRRVAAEQAPPPLDAFFGLRFDDDCDSTRTGATERPLGFTNWSEVLYFGLFNRAEFEADKAAGN